MSDIDDLAALFQEERAVVEPLTMNELLDAMHRYVPAHRIVAAVISMFISMVLFALVYAPLQHQMWLWLDPPEGYSGFGSIAIPSLVMTGITLFFAVISGGLALANQLRARYVLLVPMFAFAAVLFVAVMELNTGQSLIDLRPF